VCFHRLPDLTYKGFTIRQKVGHCLTFDAAPVTSSPENSATLL